MHTCLLGRFSHVTLCIVAGQAPVSMGFSRQEYWSGLPCLYAILIPPPRDEPALPAMEEQSLNCQTDDGVPSLTSQCGFNFSLLENLNISFAY